MPNIWHLTHQTSKYELHKVFQLPKLLTHHYSTISNMRRYGYKCQTKILIFYSTFYPSSQYFIQRFFSLFTYLSLSNPCSLSFFFRSPSLPLKSTVRRPHRSSRCRSEDAIIVGLKPPLPLRSKATIPPWSEPISARAWSCSTAHLMRISATTKSRS